MLVKAKANHQITKMAVQGLSRRLGFLKRLSETKAFDSHA